MKKKKKNGRWDGASTLWSRHCTNINTNTNGDQFQGKYVIHLLGNCEEIQLTKIEKEKSEMWEWEFKSKTENRTNLKSQYVQIVHDDLVKLCWRQTFMFNIE